MEDKQTPLTPDQPTLPLVKVESIHDWKPDSAMIANIVNHLCRPEQRIKAFKDLSGGDQK